MQDFIQYPGKRPDTLISDTILSPRGRNQMPTEKPNPVLYPETKIAKGTAAGCSLSFYYEKTDDLHINPSAAYRFRIFSFKRIILAQHPHQHTPVEFVGYNYFHFCCGEVFQKIYSSCQTFLSR